MFKNPLALWTGLAARLILLAFQAGFDARAKSARAAVQTTAKALKTHNA